MELVSRVRHWARRRGGLEGIEELRVSKLQLSVPNQIIAEGRSLSCIFIIIFSLTVHTLS